MSKHANIFGDRGPVTPTFLKFGCVAPLALLTVLAGCTSHITEEEIFDYSSPVARAAAETPARTDRKTEKPEVALTSTPLSAYQSGPGYTIRPDVTSDGRYNTYTFATEYGIYPVTGDDLARQHIQELVALDALKKRSKTGEFVEGVGGAMVSPVRAVFTTAMDPVAASRQGYSNAQGKVKAVRRGMSEAGEYITTFGKPEKKRPDRESDGLLERVVDRPTAKRRLANELKVDPYTHFVPLADELDEVASYSAAGGFGLNTAIGFVPGVGGMIISGVQTLDSVTERTLDMDPGDTAVANRERLEKMDVEKEDIKRFLLNDKLTPTEKALAVGYLDSLSGTVGRRELLSFIAGSDTRNGAFTALQTLSYLSSRPFGDEPVSHVDIVDRTPVFTVGDGKRIALVTSDELFWTDGNADQLSRLRDGLEGGGKTKPEIWISGGASSLAKHELQRQRWVVKTRVFAAGASAKGAG